MKRKIAFIKLGSFSHVNDFILQQLVTQFPEFQIDVIDVRADIMSVLPRLWFALINRAICLKEYGTDVLFGAKKFNSCLLRTSYFFKKINQEIARHLGKNDYVFTLQTQSLFDASIPGVPHFVYTDHTHLANARYVGFNRKELYSKEWIQLEKTIYQNATINFTSNTFAARSLVEDYAVDPAKVVCAYAGCNLATDFELSTKRYFNKNILFVGIDWERKGGPELVEAFKRVLTCHPDATLTIVGIRHKLDLPNCEVVGIVPREELSRYYAKATIFCLPSIREPSAQVLLEAAAYGLPVITTAVGGNPDRLLNGVSGYIIQPGDIVNLANVLIELLGDPQRAQDMGEAGHYFVRERFSWGNVGTLLSKHITAALNGKTGRRINSISSGAEVTKGQLVGNS